MKISQHPGWAARLVGAPSYAPTGCRLIQGQGTYLGGGFDSQSECVWEITSLSLTLIFLFLSPLPNINKNISLGEDLKKNSLHEHFQITFYQTYTVERVNEDHIASQVFMVILSDLFHILCLSNQQSKRLAQLL